MRRLLLATAAALGLMLPAACSGASGSGGAPDDLSSVTLRVGDQANIQQALLRASGSLNGTPYKINWMEFPAATPLLEALRGGVVDVGVAGDAPTVNALAASEEISIVAANQQSERGGLAIVVPKDSPVRTVADLRGKTVSPTSQGGIGHYLLLRALEDAGLSASDVKTSFLQPTDAASALRSGSIDAWSTWDPYAAVAEREQGARVLRDAEGLASGLSCVDANNDSLADSSTRAAMADFVRRYDRALDWARTQTPAYTRAYMELTRQPESVAGVVAQRSTRSGTPLTPAVTAQLQRVADDYHRFGVLRKRVVVN
ncbi:MAG: ABC transporter substrate-binding protein, partial [Pseudonocardia sp.]|nr:ABC transporter substrate-binding protein [Pseudonocardia sp.]